MQMDSKIRLQVCSAMKENDWDTQNGLRVWFGPNVGL